MNVEDIDAMYDLVYKKNEEIQELLVEVKDFNEILVHLYETGIRRPNRKLNQMIDEYESDVLKIREAHRAIKKSLEEFGDENALSASITENEKIPRKLKELVLWKLRRLYMVYDEEPVMPYVRGKYPGIELIPDLLVSVPKESEPEPVKE